MMIYPALYPTKEHFILHDPNDNVLQDFYNFLVEPLQNACRFPKVMPLIEGY